MQSQGIVWLKSVWRIRNVRNFSGMFSIIRFQYLRVFCIALHDRIAGRQRFYKQVGVEEVAPNSGTVICYSLWCYVVILTFLNMW